MLSISKPIKSAPNSNCYGILYSYSIAAGKSVDPLQCFTDVERVVAMSTVHMSIIVYKGSPLDYQRYRHTAFWIRFRDGSPAVLVHVVGPIGQFEFQARQAPNPSESAGFAKAIDVGFLTVSATPAQVLQALQRIPIDNTDREFNCQTWIESALRALKNWNYLSGESYERGLDGMVDAIAEAEDEEE